MARRSKPLRVESDSAYPARQSQRAALTLVEVLVIVATIGIVIALLLPAVQSARESARRNWCNGRFKMIGLALYNYEADKGEFPPAYTTDADGKPLHSWRTLILPYMEEHALFNSIDLTKPWDDAANAKALAAMPEVYRCLSRPEDDNRTTYLAIVTPESFFQPTAPRKKADVKDGTYNTIAIIEVDHAHAVPWMSPTDADENLIQSLAQGALEPPHRGFTAWYADGHAVNLDADTPSKILRQLISIADGDPSQVPWQ